MYMRNPLPPPGWLDSVTMCQAPSCRSGTRRARSEAFLAAFATCHANQPVKLFVAGVTCNPPVRLSAIKSFAQAEPWTALYVAKWQVGPSGQHKMCLIGALCAHFVQGMRTVLPGPGSAACHCQEHIPTLCSDRQCGAVWCDRQTCPSESRKVCEARPKFTSRLSFTMARTMPNAGWPISGK